MSLLQELEHLRIPFDIIRSATNNFSDQNFLGQGGFGPVYRGELTSSTPASSGTTVAVKRLDVKGGQGEHEFLMEIVMLASYKHNNLVSLIGFSDEGNEKVLVYKYEVNGSLDNHLASPTLTWEQRLRICVGAAKGLEYLHDGEEKGHRVLHRDVKSSNILLDGNWEAKISDFGLSKIGPTNVQFTFLVTNACGTFGYVDPLYVKTGVLTKESDVYSFGVVLFEVLCGRPAMMREYEDERAFLSCLVKIHKKNRTLHKIINPSLLEQMKPHSLQVYSDIAFQCLKEDRKRRPTMDLVVDALQTALKHQLDTSGIYATEPQTGSRTKLWGSVTGGRPFLFQLESGQKLRKMTIYHGQWIHSLAFTAEDSVACCILLNNSVASMTPTTRIDFDTDEEIVGLSGTVGIHHSLTLISSLSIHTNKKIHGLFGEAASTHFSGSWDLGLFDGFYGRCGWYVDALGCCLKAKIE